MNNTSKNMLLKRILAFALSFVMVVTSTPVAPLAYAEQDLNIDAAPVVISDDDLVQLDAENPTSDPAAQDPADTDPAAPAAEQDAPSQEGAAPEEELALDQAPEVAAAAVDTAAAGPARVAPAQLQDNTSQEISSSNTAAGFKVIKYDKAGTYTLTVKDGVTFYGRIEISGGAKVTVNGKGIINGNKQGSVIIVEGQNSKLTLNGPTITGGTGSELTHTKAFSANGYATCGGGVLVRLDEKQGKLVGASENGKWDGNTGATFEFISGTITNNEAEAGGGIFIDRSCGFTMNGSPTSAIVSENTATQSEGGGIYIAGHKDGNNENGATKILGGKIDGNTTKTKLSWGGGGVFIESMGVVKLTTARVTNNHAEGLGGGIAGCPHAEMGIGSIGNGFAIYGNTASWKGGSQNSVGQPTNDFLKACGDSESKKPPYFGDMYFYGLKKDLHEKASKGDYASKNFKKEYGQDYYCTKASYVTGIDLDGDATKASWIGYLAGPNDTSGKPISIAKGQSYGYNGSLALTSTYAGGEIASNVVIENNTSYTHGGGIGSNGEVQMGTLPEDEIKNPISFKIVKNVTTQWGTSLPEQVKAGQFEFKLFDQNKNYIATASNDKDGNVYFQVTSEQYKSYSLNAGATWVFYVQEVSNKSQEGNLWTNDNAMHRLEVTISSVEESSFTIGNKTTKYISPKVSADGVKLYKDETNKEVIQAITNVYNVETSATLGITKTTSGLGAGAYTFELQEMKSKSIADKDIKSDGVNDSLSVSVKESASANQTVEQFFKKLTYKQDGIHWYRIREVAGEDANTYYDPSVYLVKVEVTKSSNNKSLKAEVKETHKAADANGELNKIDNTQSPVFYNTDYTYTGFKFHITKVFQNTEDTPLPMEKFDFELWDGVPGEERSRNLGTYSTKAEDGSLSDTVVFSVKDETLLKSYLEDKAGTQQTIGNLYIREVASTNKDMLTDGKDHRVIVKLTPAFAAPTMSDSKLVSATYSCENVSWEIPSLENNTVTNRWQLRGSWTPQASKLYFGETTGSFDFTVQSLKDLKDVDLSKATVGELLRNEGEASSEDTGENSAKVSGSVSLAGGEEAPVVFATPVTYTKSGTYWYALSEDEGTDPTVYVIRVEVGQTSDNRGLEVKSTQVYYADSFETPGIYEYGTDTPQFVNTSGALKFASYRAFAASDQPVDQKCLVDPKMWKVLEGRTLKEGEFTFDLIQVSEYTDITGTVISTAKNDRYGMVDFDAANPVAGTEDDPCCLEFTAPGIYRYRVVENPGVNRDPSVIYSDQIITFTVVVEREGGSLKATDMYYGEYKDGTNVRFSESADPDWHPTMTNQARGMSLKVRKTSVLDRDNGLEGATYSLFMVNNGPQDDIKVATGTSDEDGWIQFDDVNLQAGQLYYFKEFAAPAGHTVSEFRSPFFYLVPDEASPNGYAMAYSDTKDVEPGIQVTAEGDEAESKDSDTTHPEVDENGNAVYTYSKDGGVYDEATTITFNKQETNTHNWVEGAKLQVIEKATGKVVEEWTTKAAGEVITAKLNVDTPYILHEVSAPEGYAVAKDVEFVIDSYGKISVTSGTEEGNASLSDTTLVLFDRKLDVEEINRITRTDEDDSDRTTRIAKTGDTANTAPIILGLAAVVLVGVTVLVVVKRKRNQE